MSSRHFARFCVGSCLLQTPDGHVGLHVMCPKKIFTADSTRR